MAYAGPQFYSQHQQAPSHLDTSTLPGTENSMQGQYQHAGETAVNHDLSGDHFYSRPPHQLMAPHGQFERQVDMRPDGLSVDHGQQSVGAQQNGPNGIVLSLLATQLMNTVCGVGFADQPKVIPNQPNMIPNQPNMTPAQQPFSASLGTPIIASTATPHMMNMLTGSPDESHDISTYQSWPQRGLGQFTSMGSFDALYCCPDDLHYHVSPQGERNYCHDPRNSRSGAHTASSQGGAINNTNQVLDVQQRLSISEHNLWDSETYSPYERPAHGTPLEHHLMLGDQGQMNDASNAVLNNQTPKPFRITSKKITSQALANLIGKAFTVSG
ncbi:hypothetical protein LTR28_001627 [Elasticomyces elasticus]|nr:hypothetical protein LTR28_001627 [Elasticomyces elasticus]